jgi:hypothetical protein
VSRKRFPFTNEAIKAPTKEYPVVNWTMDHENRSWFTLTGISLVVDVSYNTYEESRGPKKGTIERLLRPKKRIKRLSRLHEGQRPEPPRDILQS